MLGRVGLIAFACAAVAAVADAKTPTFDFTAQQFQDRLNAAIIEDTTSEPKDSAIIQSCRPGKKNEVVCSFRDRGFQYTVAGMKKLDLLNGNFEQKLKLTITSDAGKVTAVRLNGDRGDMPNVFAFFGTTMDVFKTFDKDVVAKDGDVTKLGDELGLMRGDSSADAGEARVVLKPYAAVKCVMLPSNISTGHVCIWSPRF